MRYLLPYPHYTKNTGKEVYYFLYKGYVIDYFNYQFTLMVQTATEGTNDVRSANAGQVCSSAQLRIVGNSNKLVLTLGCMQY